MSGFLMFVMLCCGDYTAYMLPPATETYHVYWLRDQQNPAAISAMLLTTQPLAEPAAKAEVQQTAAAQVQQAAAQATAETQALDRMLGPGHRLGRAPRATYSYILTTQGQTAIITPTQGDTLALITLGGVDADQKTVMQGNVTYAYESGTLEQALQLFGDAANAQVSPWKSSREKRLALSIARALAEQQQQQLFEKATQAVALKNGG